MRFITIVGIITLAKCINNDAFMGMWKGGSTGIFIVILIALIMDLVEFVKNLSK
tara:strand:- start:366 stop:527 length:162 start_codon:yes stop_codon:yes gene_type:complete